MLAVRTSEHNAYQIHYHFVIPVKYRLSIFGRSDREQTLIKICTEIEERYDWIFEQMGIDQNHVHFLISAAPKYSPVGNHSRNQEYHRQGTFPTPS